MRRFRMVWDVVLMRQKCFFCLPFFNEQETVDGTGSPKVDEDDFEFHFVDCSNFVSKNSSTVAFNSIYQFMHSFWCTM